MIARRLAYHGTTLGALSLTGIAAIKAPFEPLLPGVRHVSNTNAYRRPEGETEAEFTAFLLDELRGVIEQEGPHSVAAVFMEPVQNSGGTFTPPEGYFQGVRAICDEYGILLVADEVICGFGRLGYWFGSERYDIRPDVVTFAKGVGSAHVPLGGVLMSDRIAAAFLEGSSMFTHGITYGGHPVALRRRPQEPRGDGARGRARQRAPQRVVLPGHAREARATSRSWATCAAPATSCRSSSCATRRRKETFSDEECERLLRGFLSPRMLDAGLICRADDRGDPVIQLSPPLIATREDLDYVHDVLDTVLDEAWDGDDESRRPPGRDLLTGAYVLTVADIVAIDALQVTLRGGRPGPTGRCGGCTSRSSRTRRRGCAAASSCSPPACRSRSGPSAYVERLAAAGLTGLGLGLGFGYDEAPAEAVAAADRLGFPLFEIPYQVPFIAITEAVATRLSDARVAEAVRRLAGDLVEAVAGRRRRPARAAPPGAGVRHARDAADVVRRSAPGDGERRPAGPPGRGGRAVRPGQRPRRRGGGADRGP